MKLNNKGMTLIEVMIVLAIIAALVAFGVPKLFNKKEDSKTFFRKINSISKQVRDRARLYQVTYRLAFRLDEKEQSLWVEKAGGIEKIDPTEVYESAQKEKSNSNNEEDQPKSAFQQDTDLVKKPIPLPSNLKISQIEISGFDKVITTGVAYIHYTPEGFVESAIVQFVNKNNFTWSLVFNPLTGQTDLVEKQMSLKDAVQ